MTLNEVIAALQEIKDQNADYGEYKMKIIVNSSEWNLDIDDWEIYNDIKEIYI